MLTAHNYLLLSGYTFKILTPDKMLPSERHSLKAVLWGKEMSSHKTYKRGELMHSSEQGIYLSLVHG